VRAAQYGIVAFPKLDSDAQIQELRDRFSSWYYRMRPYIPIVLPFTPATLDEIQNVSDHVARARRTLSPIAVSFDRCVERGDGLFFELEDGREALIDLHKTIHGAEPLSLLKDVPTWEPLLWLGRIPDARTRSYAVFEANRIGHSIGIVDAVSMLRIEHSDEHKLAATYPFGIGRVDFVGPFPG
jgi:hypothetical protein